MSLGLILVIILVIFLLGGFSGRFGGYGYRYGHGGIGVIGVILNPRRTSSHGKAVISDWRNVGLSHLRLHLENHSSVASGG